MNKDINPEVIAASIRSELNNFIGKKNITLNNIKDVISDQLNLFLADQTIANYKVGEVTSLWNRMSFLKKLQWFWYAKVNKRKGKLIRLRIDRLNEMIYRDIKEKYPEDDPTEHYRSSIEYPDIFTPYPKAIIILDFCICPKQGIDYVTVNFMVNK